MRKTVAALSAALFIVLAGCAFFGDAETPAQKSYRLAGILAYAQIPIANYIDHPAATARVVQRVRQLEVAAYEAVNGARSAIADGGDTTTALLVASSSIADLALVVLDGGAVLPTSETDVARKSILGTQVVVQSAAAMRVFRQQVINPKLAYFAKTGNDPTEVDFGTLLGKVDAAHAAIQGSER